MREMLFLVSPSLHQNLTSERTNLTNTLCAAFRRLQSSYGLSMALTTSTLDGSDFMGERLTVQFARGSRHRDTFAAPDRTAPRPRRTAYRMQISGLPGETSWQVR